MNHSLNNFGTSICSLLNIVVSLTCTAYLWGALIEAEVLCVDTIQHIDLMLIYGTNYLSCHQY